METPWRSYLLHLICTQNCHSEQLDVAPQQGDAIGFVSLQAGGAISGFASYSIYNVSSIAAQVGCLLAAVFAYLLAEKVFHSPARSRKVA